MLNWKRHILVVKGTFTEPSDSIASRRFAPVDLPLIFGACKFTYFTKILEFNVRVTMNDVIRLSRSRRNICEVLISCLIYAIVQHLVLKYC